MKIPGRLAFAHAKGNAGRKYPGADDPRLVEGMLVPTLRPSFRIDPARPVFTLGSCFAREIEEVLLRRHVPLPTRAFQVPPEEWPYRPSGLLNEYHPGTMWQRVRAAYDPRDWPADTVTETPEGVVDLLLAKAGAVSPERLVQRRADVDAVYRQLPDAAAVVLTLGLVEAWHDDDAGVWLNRAPGLRQVKAHKGRYRFVRFDVDDAYELLERTVAAIVDHRPEVGVLLTVSPVPLQSTFTDDDCVIANAHSKAVLRACASRLAVRFRQVDYFPSFEMVQSVGPSALQDDLVHVKMPVIERMMDVLLAHYVDRAAQDAHEVLQAEASAALEADAQTDADADEAAA